MMFTPFLLITLFSGATAVTFSRFTNLKCEILDPSFFTYKQCDLKMLGRGIVGLNVQAKLLKGPITNGKINLSLWRKYNGFRPFMFNVTFDFCKLISKSVNKLSFEKLVLDSIAENSNINHSCPYEDVIHVKNMVLKEKYFKYFPAPSGEYQYQLLAATNNDWKTKIIVTWLRDEGLMKS